MAAGEETVLPFRVEVADRPGGAEISFTVSADGVNVMRAGSLSVRPASALRASAKVGVAASSTTLSTGRTLYPYGAEGSASVSALPLPALRGLVRYLDAYPYPCVEQRISRAMPYALFLSVPRCLRKTAMRMRRAGSHGRGWTTRCAPWNPRSAGAACPCGPERNRIFW